ncbi:helix-turn-helix domain-containing protein [Hymenobacter glacieicola]|uniref:helix-turn-helix domain-containing protein n=1 Tax=Hymenobacter glacieicola TaxID=1562124 RepID=UPI00166E3793|nr:helix-turn-helix domain-containing protein [Hymenobacter glacieicola]
MEEPLRALVEKIEGPFQAFVEQTVERLVQDHFANWPKPDPQYTLSEVAELLAVDISTIYSYLKKPVGHLHRLPFVQCTDTPRGKRIRLSDILVWQQHNSSDALSKAKQEEVEQKVAAMGARRRARRGGTSTLA